jgi:hypothetical protein
VIVTVDEKKFDEKFLKEYRETFYDFETIEDHCKHLAGLYVRGMIGDRDAFIEGYGDPREMGIKFEVIAHGSEVSE